jgi:glycosyltransferase involved in cell wall biosynthesis
MGGAERSLLDVFASLRKAEPGWTLDLIAGGPGPFAEEAHREAGVRTHVLPLPDGLAGIGDSGVGGPAGRQQSRGSLACKLGSAGVSVARYTHLLRQTIRCLNPDLIHTNGFKMHLLGAWAAAGVPLVWHIHDYVQLRPLMAKLLRMHAGRCTAAIANSDSVAQDFRIACRPGPRIHTVWNAVDLEQFSPTGKQLDLDAACGLPTMQPGGVRVGLVGTLARWKGHKVFMKAIQRLPPQLPVRAYIIGGAVYQTEGSQWSLDELKKMGAEFGLAGRLGFTGFLQRPAEAMRALDIVVHASTQPEPFGLVIAEAMACGKAVIVSRWGGPEEFTEDGVNAVQHAPGDFVSLARLITKLSENGVLRRQLGQAGRRTTERHFDRDRLAKQLVPIYRSVMLARGARIA